MRTLNFKFDDIGDEEEEEDEKEEEKEEEEEEEEGSQTTISEKALFEVIQRSMDLI